MMRRFLRVSRGRWLAHVNVVDGLHEESPSAKTSGERGAILILAFVYLVAVGLIVAALSTWATNDLNNSTQFTSANSTTLAATDMMNVAIQYVRYNPVISNSQPVLVSSPLVACWGGSQAQTSSIPVINGDQIAVWCSTVWDPLNQVTSNVPQDVTRDVTFVACPIAVTAVSCQASPLLTAVVQYDDYPPAPARSAPIQTLCSVWCGAGMEIVTWQWGSTGPAAVSGPATTLTFSNEPSDTSAFATTEAAVYATDASGNPVQGDTISIQQQTGITSASSTLTAVTNSSGVAEFTNIVPQLPGSYTLTAGDPYGNSTTSTQFNVSKQRAVLAITSTAPTSATSGGTPYYPTAVDKSIPGDTVAITLDPSSSGCALSAGKVTFTGPGTCVLDFNDPATGNPIYSAALQLTQSFPVGGLSATQVAITLSPSSPPNPVTAPASGTANVTVSMTLENAVGVAVPSSGTTTLVLSDIGSGDFATKLGVTGSSTLNVSFTNTATATAYFYNGSLGPDTISAVNGTTHWGSASLTIIGGAPTQVVITPNPSSAAVSSVTNTSLTFQLEDQFGDPATSSGTTTLVLSDSGNGFFATSNGTSGTSTLNITFANLTGTATAYFGNETSGSDVITAKNGASVWGTSTVSPVAGAASSVQISLSTTTPKQSAVTNTTVSLQLVDQFGNYVTTSNVSLVLSNSGNGFFAAHNTIAGSPTMPVTTVSGAATAYFGDDTNNQSVTITATGPGFAVTTPKLTI